MLDNQLIYAINLAFEKTIDSDFRQRMCAVLLNTKGDVISIGNNVKKLHWWMSEENGYREDAKYRHCEIDCIQNYIDKNKDKKITFEKDILKSLKKDLVQYCKQQDFNTMVIMRRKGGLFSDMYGCSKPCDSCLNLLKIVGIKNIVYYSIDNKIIKEQINE